MAVDLDQVPSLAERPKPPRIWLWLCLMLLSPLLGLFALLVFSSEPLRHQPTEILGATLVVPLLGLCIVCVVRGLHYVGQQHTADGWDDARANDLAHRIRRGQRYQQLLAIGLYTGLRTDQAGAEAQLDAILNGTKVLKAQPSRLGKSTVRHSRLSGDVNEDPERALLCVMKRVLMDLACPLSQVSDDVPLALLLEFDSQLQSNQLHRVWQRAWLESGIRQPLVPIAWSGLDAVDQWLDQRSDDQALLLVVAVQFAPERPEGTAEAAVGLLLGNPVTQTSLPLIANLHRPEQVRGDTADAVLHAVRQALNWVPLEANAVEHVWQVGIGQKHKMAVTSVLNDPMLQLDGSRQLHNLDGLLGHPCRAAAWVAIAAAAQTIQHGAGPQFIFSGESSAKAALWGTVLTPVSVTSK
nr:hypothetical protein [Pseudomonas asiatica]